MAFLCQPLTLSASQGVHRPNVEFQIDRVLSSWLLPTSNHSVPPPFRSLLNGFQTLVRLSDLAVCFARPTASLLGNLCLTSGSQTVLGGAESK